MSELNPKLCNKCGQQGKIVKSRQREGGYVARRYNCPGCNKWSTLEIRVDRMPEGTKIHVIHDNNRPDYTVDELLKMLKDKWDWHNLPDSQEAQ